MRHMKRHTIDRQNERHYPTNAGDCIVAKKYIEHRHKVNHLVYFFTGQKNFKCPQCTFYTCCYSECQSDPPHLATQVITNYSTSAGYLACNKYKGPHRRTPITDDMTFEEIGHLQFLGVMFENNQTVFSVIYDKYYPIYNSRFGKVLNKVIYDANPIRSNRICESPYGFPRIPDSSCMKGDEQVNTKIYPIWDGIPLPFYDLADSDENENEDGEEEEEKNKEDKVDVLKQSLEELSLVKNHIKQLQDELSSSKELIKQLRDDLDTFKTNVQLNI